MADKIPLKLEAGKLKQFAAGDTISATIAPGSGGSPLVTQVSVNLPYPAKRSHSVSIVDAGVTAIKKLIVSLAGVAETETNSSDTVDSLSIMAVPAAGSFLFQAIFLTPIAGPLKINYLIGT